MKWKKTIDINPLEVEDVNYTDENYCGEFIHISKGYFDLEPDRKFVKSLSLSMWDDFSFEGHYKLDDFEIVKELKFNINYNDPIYFHLSKVLDYINPLVIYDDETDTDFDKYMKIEKNDHEIGVQFINQSDDKYDLDRFKIFVKNIVSDPRSRIEDDNIKYKLIQFFRDVKDMYDNDFYQMDIDEYLERQEIKK